MRALQWLIGATIVWTAANAHSTDAWAQAAHPAGGTTAHHTGAASGGGAGTAHHASAAPGGASAAPASSASPAPTCNPGEAMSHGHCCLVGSDWAAPQHQCMAHNRRQAMVAVAVTNPHGALPSDLAVTIDGNAATGTPPTASLAPGSHTVHIAATGFRPVDQTLTLTAGQVQWVNVALEATVGSVHVNVTTAGAQVTLDGQPLQGTDAGSVAPGPHHLVVSAPDHVNAERDVTVAAGETATVDVGELEATPPPSPSPAPEASPAPPPPPRQLLTVVVAQPGRRFDVDIVAGTHHFTCDGGVTSDHPCTVPNVPAGAIHVSVSGPVDFADEARMPVGAATLTLEFESTPYLRGVYAALGIVSIVPTVIAFVAAGTCGGGPNCDALPWLGVGLLAVPAIIPGAFFDAQALREQGHGHMHLVAADGSDASPAPAASSELHRARPAIIGSRRYHSPALVAPPSIPALFTF